MKRLLRVLSVPMCLNILLHLICLLLLLPGGHLIPAGNGGWLFRPEKTSLYFVLSAVSAWSCILLLFWLPCTWIVTLVLGIADRQWRAAWILLALSAVKTWIIAGHLGYTFLFF